MLRYKRPSYPDVKSRACAHETEFSTFRMECLLFHCSCARISRIHAHTRMSNEIVDIPWNYNYINSTIVHHNTPLAYNIIEARHGEEIRPKHDRIELK